VTRFSTIAFSGLVAATVAAFFVTQHLKVSTPLIAGSPKPVPGVIDPYGAKCGGVDHSRMRISFYLQHRSDDVSVYIVDSTGTIIRTLASARHMRKGIRNPDGEFTWNGREDNGSVAPDGSYYVRVALLQQGRTAEITDSAGHPVPIKIKTIPPHPRVTGVQVIGAPTSQAPLISPPGAGVKISYTGTEHRSGIIRIYRTDLPQGIRLVKSFTTGWNSTQAKWDGLIHKLPAPQGTYLIGLDVTDAACNTGHFPTLMPPTPGSTAHAGVTVRYLAAQPPLTSVPAGSKATVYVDADQLRYEWTLWRVGARRPSAHGAQRSFALQVRLPPAQDAGLYHVVIDAGGRRTDVPLVADHPGLLHRPRILVVLPALSWQGENPVDDPPDYDGIPNTLDAGGPVLLARPLVDGLPGGFADEAAFLASLDRAHLRYDLTTDAALIAGTGPSLAGHTAVVLAGSESWVPASFGSSLRAYVDRGGHVLSLGLGSLLRTVRVTAGRAYSPSEAASTDLLAARPAPLVAHNTELILVIRDGLGVFTGTSGGFGGYSSYEPIRPVPTPASEAGVSDSSPSIVGYRLGRGIVVDIGLVGFGSSLASNVDAKELVGRLWRVLGLSGQ
jgi:hypothetical protein